MNPIPFLRVFLLCCAATLSASAAAQIVANSSFETPALAAGTFSATPTGASWTFSGSAGISNGSNAFYSGSPEIPDGKQVVFLQNAAGIQHTLTLSSGAVLVFNATQRVNFGTNQTLQVLVNGVPQTFSRGSSTGSVSTTSVVPPKNYYGSYAVNLSSVTTSGPYTVRIAGTNSTGDATAFVDTVSITTPSAHWYGLWDTGLISARWRSDYQASTTSPQVVTPCIFPNSACPGYPASYPSSNWTHSSSYVAGATHWGLSWNDDAAQSLACASGPPDQSLPVVTPGTAGAAFNINAVTAQSDPSIGNYNVASIIYSGGLHPNCIPYLGFGVDYRHGNTKPVAVLDRAGRYRPHVKFHETIMDADANSVALVRLVISTDGWSDNIPRQLQVDLAARRFGPEQNGLNEWNFPAANSWWYPGAYVSYWDVSYVNSSCGMTLPSLSFSNTYVASGGAASSIKSYDIDLYALLSCVASHHGWVAPADPASAQQLPDPVVVTHVEWSLEAIDSTAVPAPAVWIAMWNPSIQ